MGMATISIGVVARGSSDQSALNSVGITLLILGTRQSSRYDALSTTGRRTIRASPGEPIEVVVTELLRVGLSAYAGLDADDVAHCIVGGLRLIEDVIAATRTQTR